MDTLPAFTSCWTWGQNMQIHTSMFARVRRSCVSSQTKWVCVCVHDVPIPMILKTEECVCKKRWKQKMCLLKQEHVCVCVCACCRMNKSQQQHHTYKTALVSQSIVLLHRYVRYISVSLLLFLHLAPLFVYMLVHNIISTVLHTCFHLWWKGMILFFFFPPPCLFVKD